MAGHIRCVLVTLIPLVNPPKQRLIHHHHRQSIQLASPYIRSDWRSRFVSPPSDSPRIRKLRTRP